MGAQVQPRENEDGLGWRAIFLVNVPVGAAALIAAAIVVPHARGHRRPRLDPAGAVGVSASLALALVPLTLGHDECWPGLDVDLHGPPSTPAKRSAESVHR